MGRATRKNVTVAQPDWAEAEAAISWQGPKLILLVGLPGSGKSSWAEWVAGRQDCSVISADTVRLEIFGSLQEANSGGRAHHARVFEIVHGRLRKTLRAGSVAIADATNLYASARSPLLLLAKEEDADVEILFFDNVSAALRRNRLRPSDAVVPEEVMKRLAQKTQNLEDHLSREGRVHRIS